jgi:antimicrobial peptide system SdpB family protein
MLTALGASVARRLRSTNPWGTGYAVARTLVALGTLSTLLASPTATLFLPTSDRLDYPICSDVARLGLFCIDPTQLASAHAVAVALMLPVVLGLWPRLFGLVHWWIAFSFQANATMVDGGDQIAAILALLLLPVTLTDPRWSHWAPLEPQRRLSLHGVLLATAGWLAVRLQVAIIYFHACVSKFAVPEWVDGTALYYWASDPQFGATGLVRMLLKPLFESSAVAVVTWSVLAIELSLAMGIVMPARARRALLWPGVLLHVGIAVVHGLLSFSLVMCGALVLYSGWHPTLRRVPWPGARLAREPHERPRLTSLADADAH